MSNKRPRGALLIVDVQYDFLPGGTLAVEGGNEILQPVYRLLEGADWISVIASQDYHPRGHISFASRHGKPPFTTIEVSCPPGASTQTRSQEMWPDHCVQGTHGSELEAQVQSHLERVGGTVVRKGTDVDMDAYSAFAVPLTSHFKPTPAITEILDASSIEELFIVGLATDFCVKATTLAALDAMRDAENLKRVYVVREAVRGIDNRGSELALQELVKAGATVVSINGEELRPYWKP